MCAHLENFCCCCSTGSSIPTFSKQTTVYVLSRYIVAKVLTWHIAREYVAIACRDTLLSHR